MRVGRTHDRLLVLAVLTSLALGSPGCRDAWDRFDALEAECLMLGRLANNCGGSGLDNLEQRRCERRFAGILLEGACLEAAAALDELLEEGHPRAVARHEALCGRAPVGDRPALLEEVAKLRPVRSAAPPRPLAEHCQGGSAGGYLDAYTWYAKAVIHDLDETIYAIQAFRRNEPQGFGGLPWGADLADVAAKVVRTMRAKEGDPGWKVVQAHAAGGGVRQGELAVGAKDGSEWNFRFGSDGGLVGYEVSRLDGPQRCVDEYGEPSARSDPNARTQVAYWSGKVTDVRCRGDAGGSFVEVFRRGALPAPPASPTKR